MPRGFFCGKAKSAGVGLFATPLPDLFLSLGAALRSGLRPGPIGVSLPVLLAGRPSGLRGVSVLSLIHI